MAPLPEASGGAWRSAVPEMEIEGLDADGFLTWWRGKPASGDRTALPVANPEHYLADSADGVVEIVETIGSGPLRFFLTFHDGVAIGGERHATYPVRIGGTSHLARRRRHTAKTSAAPATPTTGGPAPRPQSCSGQMSGRSPRSPGCGRANRADGRAGSAPVCEHYAPRVQLACWS